MIRWFQIQIERVKRMVYWGWNLRDSYDFDTMCMYQMMALKLERIHDVMKNHSHLQWNSDERNNSMRKLSEAKMLAKRISKERYDMRAWEETEARYGVDFSNGLPIWKYCPEKAQKFFLTRAKHYDKMEKYEWERFHYLLEKYSKHWWD